MHRVNSLLLVALVAVHTASANPIAPSSLIPETGPYGSFAVLFSPNNLPGATDAAAADYLRLDGRRLGSLLAASTTSNYNADLVTAAFSEGSIQGRSSRVMAGAAFDVLTVLLEDGSEVFAIGFTAGVLDDQLIVDGSAPYSLLASGEALHVVAWAETEEAAALLIASSLELASLTQPLGFAQEVPFSGPVLAAPTAYPNPFGASSTITVSLDDASQVELAIFDALGRRVAFIVSANLDAGAHRFAFEGNELPGGVYFARLLADRRLSTTRITRLH